MPRVDLGDFSKVGVLPPEGYYRLTPVKDVKLKPNSKKDGHNIVVDFGFADLPDGVDEAFGDFTFRYWASLKPAAKAFFKQFMVAMTQDEERWSGNSVDIETDDDDILTDPSFEGVTVMALLKHGKDNNNSDVIQVAKFFPDDGEVVPEVAQEEEE